MTTLSTRVDFEVIMDFELPALLPGLVLDGFARSLKLTSTLDAQPFMPFLKGSGLLLSEK